MDEMSLYLQNRMVLGTVGSCCCCYHHDQITIFLNVLCHKSFPSQSILHSLSEPFASNVSLITALQGPLLPSVSAKFLIWALGAPASDASPALFLAMPSGILDSGHREQLAVPPLQLLWFLLGFGTQFLFPFPTLLGRPTLSPLQFRPVVTSTHCHPSLCFSASPGLPLRWHQFQGFIIISMTASSSMLRGS